MLAALLHATLGSAWAAPAAPGKKGRTQPPQVVSRTQLEAAAQRLETGLGKAQHSAPDTLRLAALRVAFPNLDFGASPPPELHDRFWFETQFSYVREYFDAASLGATVVLVDVPDTVAMAAQNQEYYGNFALYDSLMIELLGEVVPQFDPLVDYRDYHGVILLHAGPGQESDLKGDSPRQIWSGYLDQETFREQLSTPDSTVDGLPTQDGGHLLSDVIILPEWEVQDLLHPDDTRLGHLGVYVHEIGQKLGMLPLFDPTPSPIPDSQGVGNFGVMGYGLWVANGFIPTLPNAFNRALMGWIEPQEVTNDADIVLRDYERGTADSVLVRVPISGREYFLVQYVVEDPDGAQWWVCDGDTIGYQRVFHFDDKNGNCRFDFEDTNGDSVLSPGDVIDSYAGAEWNFFMTDLIGLDTAGLGYGLLILHIDEQRILDVLRARAGSVQSDPRHKGVDVEEADGIEDLDRGADNPRSFGSFEDYWFLQQEFGPGSTPSSAGADGRPTGVRITLVDLPEATSLIAGARAHVRIRRGPTSQEAASPQRTAARRLAGWQGADLTLLPQADGSDAVIVVADSGRVFLLDSELDEAPVADADSSTLTPWQMVPPAWAGRWSAPPVVGDLDGDQIPEVILCAEVDSAQQVWTRVFAWRRDGSEFFDHDANPSTHVGWFASVAGRTERLLVSDLHSDAGSEIVVATRDSAATTLHLFASPLICPVAVSTAAALSFELPAGEQLVAGPVVVRGDYLQCTDVTGLGWVARTGSGQELTYQFHAIGQCCGLGPPTRWQLEPAAGADAHVQLLATDLDGDGADEVVVLHEDGRIEVLAAPTHAQRIHRRARNHIADRSRAELAVADVDGNGTLEILVSGEQAFHVLSLSGAELPGWPYRYQIDPSYWSNEAAGRGAAPPLVADLDANGGADILSPLAGGGLLVWDASGRRQPQLEASLPAWHIDAPAFVRDATGTPVLTALARFERTRAFDPVSDSLTTASYTELATWRWPLLRGSDLIWSQRGGDGSGAFRYVFVRGVPASGNDPALPGFVVGPNPASEELRARLPLTAAAMVTCTLFNLEGQIVQSQQRAGVTGELVEFVFDLSRLASGPYLARMQISTGGQRVRTFVVRR